MVAGDGVPYHFTSLHFTSKCLADIGAGDRVLGAAVEPSSFSDLSDEVMVHCLDVLRGHAQDEEQQQALQWLRAPHEQLPRCGRGPGDSGEVPS